VVLEEEDLDSAWALVLASSSFLFKACCFRFSRGLRKALSDESAWAGGMMRYKGAEVDREVRVKVAARAAALSLLVMVCVRGRGGVIGCLMEL